MSDPAAFIRHLRRLGARDLGGVAILRRSLAHEPGSDVRAYPMVEPYLPSDWPWARTAYYLVAGLWASVNTASVLARATPDEEEVEGSAAAGEAETPAADAAPAPDGRRGPDRRAFGHAVAQLYRERARAESIEQRFIALLDADEEQLPYRLRQMVQLVKGEEGIRIHWVQLLEDVLRWNGDERRVQQRWARAFYRDFAATADTAAAGDDEDDKGA